eukprot:2398994-Prorocentrum_lima.AAC.1
MALALIGKAASADTATLPLRHLRWIPGAERLVVALWWCSGPVSGLDHCATCAVAQHCVRRP